MLEDGSHVVFDVYGRVQCVVKNLNNYLMNEGGYGEGAIYHSFILLVASVNRNPEKTNANYIDHSQKFALLDTLPLLLPLPHGLGWYHLLGRR